MAHTESLSLHFLLFFMALDSLVSVFLEGSLRQQPKSDVGHQTAACPAEANKQLDPTEPDFAEQLQEKCEEQSKDVPEKVVASSEGSLGALWDVPKIPRSRQRNPAGTRIGCCLDCTSKAPFQTEPSGKVRPMRPDNMDLQPAAGPIQRLIAAQNNDAVCLRAKKEQGLEGHMITHCTASSADLETGESGSQDRRARPLAAFSPTAQ